MDKSIHIKFFTYQNNQSFLLRNSTITMNCQQYENFPIYKIDHTICTKKTTTILHTQLITAKRYYLVQRRSLTKTKVKHFMCMNDYTTDVRQKEKTSSKKNRSVECIVTPTITTTNDDPSHENDNDCRSTFVGIIQDKSNHSNSDNNTSKKQNNNDDQQHHEHTVSKRVHHEIGVVADFVSVSEKTGNTSSLSEEQLSNVDVTLYIPALFHLKKFISSQEELEWKGIIAKFFYKKNGC